jgi:hypothetical protein
MLTPRLITVLLLSAALWLLADVASACPTCKDQLAHDPAAANIARGYAWSIVFMLSMPPLILTGLLSYFYWEICRARTALAASAGNNVDGLGRFGTDPLGDATTFAASGRGLADSAPAT